MSAPERIWTCAHVGEYGSYFPEAVEAEGEYGGAAVEYIRADLAPVQYAPSAKALEWKAYGESCWIAPAPLFGSFRVEHYGNEKWQALWSVPGYCATFADGDFATADDAKAAIDARVLSALEPAQEGE